jgi:hypothetical protein
MFPPKFVMKEISVGSGNIIGKENIEEFFSHVSRLFNLEAKSLVELTYNYETAVAALVQMIEARFVNINPIIQQMFLKLDSMEEGKDKDFVIKTLLNEFYDVAKEARMIFDRYGFLDRNKYVGRTTNKGATNVPIPFKLLGIAEALDRNFDWISPENLFDETSQSKGKKKVDPEPCIRSIQCLHENFATLDLNDDINNAEKT